jgi:hypothetical protein
VRAALLLLLIASHARADATDIVDREVVLPRHHIRGALTLGYSLVARSEGTPLSIAPDLWAGVTEDLTVGVIHSAPSVDRIDARASICLRESALGCDRAYQGSGLDVRYRLGPSQSRISVAARTRFLIRDVDPWKPAVTIGAVARWSRGRFSIATDPFLRFGLANTDKGNRTAFALPLWLGVQPTCRWLLQIHSGADGDLAVIRDGWHIPFSLVVTARATSKLDVILEAGFSQLYGPQTDIRQRSVLLTVAWQGGLR